MLLRHRRVKPRPGSRTHLGTAGLVNAKATLTVTSLAEGQHTIEARYQRNDECAPSTSHR
jgi:hypothetical protein